MYSLAFHRIASGVLPPLIRRCRVHSVLLLFEGENVAISDHDVAPVVDRARTGLEEVTDVVPPLPRATFHLFETAICVDGDDPYQLLEHHGCRKGHQISL